MKKEMSISVVYALTVVAMFFWGIAFVWMRQAYDVGFRPITVVFLRLVVASVVLSIASLAMKNTQVIARKDYLLIFLLAFAEPYCYFLGESFGMLYVTPTLAAIMVSLIPLVTPIFALLFLRERVSVFQIVGLVISFTGVLVLVLENLNLGGRSIGILLMCIAVLSGTAYGIILKKLTSSYNALTITMYQTFIGAVLFLPLFFIFDLRQFMSLPFDVLNFRYIVLLGALPSSLSFTLLAIAVHRIGIIRANVFTNLIPVFTAVIAYFVLKESFSMVKVFAMGVVILGLSISQLNQFRKRFT